MKIDEIENGIVFDHIAAGKGMEVYNTLRLDKLKCQVAIIQNAKSEKMGAKDIIKINELIDINLDVLCYNSFASKNSYKCYKMLKLSLHLQ